MTEFFKDELMTRRWLFGSNLRGTLTMSFKRNGIGRRAARLAYLSVALCAAGATASVAQNYGNSNNGFDGKQRTSDLIGPANPLAAPTREYMGVPIAGWMVNASVLTGVSWDDNVFQANVNSVDDWAARIRPQLELNRNNGMHSTTLYGFADARFYDEQEDANLVRGSVGARHVWEVQRDFVVKSQASYTRAVDISNSGTLITANGLQPIASPIESNVYSGTISFERTQGSFFYGMAGDVTYSDFLTIEDSLGRRTSQDDRDADYYGFTGRAGVWVSPVFYTFLQGTQGWQSYRDGLLDNQTQRVLVGVGTDRVSLFKGEVYAGYQRRDYDAAALETQDAAVYGGQLFWYPTRDFTLGLNADRSLGEATLRTAGNANGSPTETTAVNLTGDYILDEIWTLSAKVGYSNTDFLTGTREDDMWSGGVAANYFIWRNLAATFEWEYVDVESNISSNSFERNQFTAGATYKY